MSRLATNTPNSSQSDRHYKKPRQDVHEVLRQIDDKLNSLSDRVIPSQPYILSVPTDVPYRFDKRFINTWYIGTPFGPHEEQLQYMSFLPHQGSDEELLKVIGGWSDAEGNLIDEDAASQTQILSGQNTPVQQPHRKKISLKDYKTKGQVKNREAAADTELGNGDQAMKPSAKEHVVKAEEKVRGPHTDNHKPTKTGKQDSKAPLQRPLPSKPPTVVRQPDSPSPPKRRRLSSDEPATDDDRGKTEQKERGKEKKALPALLSPTLPASSRNKTDRGLPKLLSPDLPPSLEKILGDGHTLKRTDQVKAILASALSPAPKKAGDKPIEDGRNRSDSQLSTKSLLANNKASPLLKPLVKAESRPATPIQPRSPGPRQRHIIVLKYGRKNRKRVEGLLKLSPRPRKAKTVSTPLDGTPRRTQEPPRDATKTLPVSAKAERKRLAEPSPERPTKKIKPLVETPERSRTPQMATKSPAVKIKAEPHVTPKKELKPSTMMQRIASSEGMDVKTPPIDGGRISTPLGSLQTKESPAPNPAPAGREGDRSGWSEIRTKYFALGRSLKKDAQNLAASKAETDQALSVIIHVEALLCFMINLTAESFLRSSADPGWNTIMPYHIFIFKASRRYRHLHGLIIQLGAVCRQILHNHNIERLSRDPLPDEQCGSAPTPGSDGNTKTDDGEKYKKRYLEFRNDLIFNSRELQSAWLEGSRYLPPYLLEKEYPKTWAARAKDTSSRNFARPNPSKISDAFFIPLDACSNTFEVMRFALEFMGEWCGKERLSWKPKIEF